MCRHLFPLDLGLATEDFYMYLVIVVHSSPDFM